MPSTSGPDLQAPGAGRGVLLGLLLAITGVHVLWTLLGAPPEGWRERAAPLFYWPVYALAAVIVWQRARRSAPDLAWFWTWMALGLGAWGAGQVTFTVLAALGVRGFPHPAAYLYLAAPLSFALGLRHLLRTSAPPDRPARVGLDTALMTLMVGHLLWTLTGQATAQGYAGQPVALILALAFPATDLLLAALLTALALTRPLLLNAAQLLLLIGALLSFLGGDVLWAVLLSTGQYRLGHPLDSLWSLAAALIALSACYRHPWPWLQAAAQRRTIRALSPHAALAFVYVVYVIFRLSVHAPSRADDLWLIGVTVLFAVRQLLVLRDNQTLQRRLLHSQAHLNAVMNTMSESIYLKDRQGRYQLLNPAARQLLGPQAAGVGATDADLFPAEARQIQALDQEVMRTLEPVTVETRSPSQTRVLMTTKHPFVVDGELLGVLGVSRDVTLARELEQELERQVRRTSSILESLPSAFVALDHDGRLTYINPVAASLLQRRPGDLIGQSVWDVLRRQVDPDTADYLRRTLERGTPQFEVYSPVTRRWYDLSAAPTEDGLAVSFTEITARKATEESLRLANDDLERRVKARTAELEHLAYRDVLTGLPSRRAFEETFEAAVAEGRAFQLLVLDLDDLKVVNDQAGHAQGDQLLRCFGRALTDTFGPTGQVFRQGGDEFTVLVTSELLSTDELLSHREQLRQFMDRQGFPAVRASTGAASFPQDARSPNDLFRLADQRMLRDKAAIRTVRGLRGERLLLRDSPLTAEMVWQALRATSSLISSDGALDAEGWQAFLQAAVTAVPSAEAGSLFVLEGSRFVLRAQVGYSETLLGTSHSLENMRRWTDAERTWPAGQARVVRGAADVRRVTHLPAEWSEREAPWLAGQHQQDLAHLQANVCVPVLVAGAVVAVINLDNLRSEQAFDAFELDIAEEFGRQAAAILTMRDRRARAADRTRELEVLAHASAALSLVLDPHDLERTLINETLALFRTEHAAFARYDPQTHAAHLDASAGLFGSAAHQTVPAGEGLIWQALHTGQVQRTERLTDDAWLRRAGTSADGSVMAAPLISLSNRPVGALLVARSAAQSFSPLDASLLGALASAGVIAFERLRVITEEQKRAEALRALADLASQVGLAADVDTVARECLTLSRSVLQADLAVFLCPDRDVEVVVDAATGSAETPPRELALAALRHASGGAERASSSGLTSGLPPALLAAGVNALIEAPVHERGRPAGRLALLWFTPPETTGRMAEALLNRSAELIGQVLDRRAHLADLEATREGALLALGLSLELRDFETAGHTERVVALALRIGEALGLSPEQREDLRLGAYLHDIGKLGIPDAILLKPGRLDPAEWHLMQRHAEFGDELVRRIPTVPSAARAVVRHHHERWDGTGYPDRLAGTAIPLGARIFSVADVYDALTSDRPYKPAWSALEAVTELRDQAGRQFDPDVVSTALRVLSSTAEPEPDT
ncbi:HD domain-containing phosphohydrolase [Deinococcus radiotolerans]|uniref:Diguanylate cyclase and metal dependent phosphohydrolase n=1 Tax=Deinococcus radiotolerans TaxID=1309407 RepID=A0ABQ2FPG9_9DEIO|nr:HD domain-containing phosphohydrolase [Deinococcus radiotolerans]GGL13805.1 hypothetical protein GCM10010844_35820 [Deinococcus radiotolerans]